MADLPSQSLSHIVSFLHNRKGQSLIFFICICCNCFILPCFGLKGSLAVLKFTVLETEFDGYAAVKNSPEDLSSAKILTDEANAISDKLDSIFGRYVTLGHKSEAEGTLYEIKIDCESESESNKEDEAADFTDLPKDWVGIIDYGKCSSGTREGDNHKSVIEKMKTALLFGASAIIILSLNPRLIKEIDVSDMFSKPIILIDSAENITTLLSILYSKIAVKVKVTINSTLEDLQKQTTFTWWTSCGWSIGTVHGREWAGVVCLDKHDTRGSKADPSSFWNFFYSALLSLMLLFIVKAKRRDGEWGPADPDMELSLRRLAYQAISLMKTKRYKSGEDSQGKPRDMCAICLDFFKFKQKIRVLPCLHEFHTYCVDAWLVNNRTCPLCKLNILGHVDKC